MVDRQCELVPLGKQRFLRVNIWKIHLEIPKRKLTPLSQAQALLGQGQAPMSPPSAAPRTSHLHSALHAQPSGSGSAPLCRLHPWKAEDTGWREAPPFLEATWPESDSGTETTALGAHGDPELEHGSHAFCASFSSFRNIRLNCETMKSYQIFLWVSQIISLAAMRIEG